MDYGKPSKSHRKNNPRHIHQHLYCLWISSTTMNTASDLIFSAKPEEEVKEDEIEFGGVEG